MLRELIKKFEDSSFRKLFFAFFFSELGGYLTNTVILIYIHTLTDGNKFYLGLSQVFFVGPLALGSLLGGYIGESFNRRKIMLLCESMNLLFICVLLNFEQVYAIIAIRAIIVFFAGIYNPCRQSIVQEIVKPENLKAANATFTTAFAFMHSVGPMLGALAYKHFGGIQEVLIFNLVTYTMGVLLLYKMKYMYREEEKVNFQFSAIYSGVKEGFLHVYRRSDLNALWQNVSLGGICLGVFYPSLLPFLSEVFPGDETIYYGRILFAFGLGGIAGGLVATLLMRIFKKGKVLVVFAILQSILLLSWTIIRDIHFSYFVMFLWGMGMVSLITTYINYIQINVSRNFQCRTFSLYDQSTYFSVIIGAAIVSIVGNKLNAQELLSYTASFALIILLLRTTTKGMRSLYFMES